MDAITTEAIRVAKINFQTEFVNGELSGSKLYCDAVTPGFVSDLFTQVLEVHDLGSYRVVFVQNRWKMQEF